MKQSKEQQAITKNFQNGAFYHRTDGGAEYLSTEFIECANGHREGISPFFARIDGGEFELFAAQLKNIGFNRIRINNVIIEL